MAAYGGSRIYKFTHVRDLPLNHHLYTRRLTILAGDLVAYNLLATPSLDIDTPTACYHQWYLSTFIATPSLEDYCLNGSPLAQLAHNRLSVNVYSP